MKVLLLENIQSLGKRGEIVEVKDGYGQNFLIAKNKAKLATNEVIKRYEAEQRNNEEKLALENAERKALAKTLETIKLKIFRKCGESGALFGSITKEEIVLALQDAHRLTIHKKQIEFEGQIKHIGEHHIVANLGNGIHAKFTLIVQGEKDV